MAALQTERLLSSPIGIIIKRLLKRMTPNSVAPVVWDRIGIELEGIGGRGLEFVDAAKSLKIWESLEGKAACLDKEGWPTGDTRGVFFDLRPLFASAPPMDDPEAYQIDLSGIYHLSFSGEAVISSAGDPFKILGQNYDAIKNLNQAEILFPPKRGLLSIQFAKTNGGIRNVTLIRPPYPADTNQIFHTPFLNAIAPFKAIRFMNFLETNNNNPPFPEVTHWPDRKLPIDASQFGGKAGGKGVAWEYVIELGNATGKDIWINIPIAADDDYIFQLATLFKNFLSPELNIYIEYSNEVWNWNYTQAKYNRDAAVSEVQEGGSELNCDGSKDPYTWAQRRCIRQAMRISHIFKKVFDKSGKDDRIRVIHTWCTGHLEQYEDQLKWLSQYYGSPNQFFYGLGTSGYLHYFPRSSTEGVHEIIKALRSEANSAGALWDRYKKLADAYGLKMVVYEGGTDTGSRIGDPTNVANRIMAERHPDIGDIINHHLGNNWFAQGGDLYIYYMLTSAYSRYGCWGLTDDIDLLNRNSKYSTLMKLIGH